MENINFAAHCASLCLEDIEENIQFNSEVKSIIIYYPKSVQVAIEPVSDLVGLIREFIKFFKTWENDPKFQRCHSVDDYFIEGIVILENDDAAAEFEIGS